MTNTAAAENLAAGDKGKDKAEKRRALGRGLESLLPGPRVVPGNAAGSAPAAQVGGAGGKQQVPHFVRNDAVGGVPIEGTIQAVVDDAVYEDAGDEAVQASAELRSAGQPGAAVPTSLPTSVPTSGAQEPITIFAQAEGRIPGNLVINLAIAEIDKNPFQTRRVHTDDAFEELTESIKANGVLQPIVVRPGNAGRYILILGQRRMHAAAAAGKETIPAIVRRVSDQQAAEMTIVENLQREDLSPLEQAQAFRVLSEEFKLTQTEIGERVGLSRESVANYMRLLRLPREVMELLAEKKLKFSEARELLKLESDQQIVEAALYAVKQGLTAEQVEKLVMRMGGWLDAIPGMPGLEKKKSGARWVDPNVRAAQLELERILGVRVRIRDRKGKGKIVIEYATVDDFDRVLEALRRK
jgi:ParB family transcriptional regulator, chromosome partitioning protein